LEDLVYVNSIKQHKFKPLSAISVMKILRIVKTHTDWVIGTDGEFLVFVPRISLNTETIEGNCYVIQNGKWFQMRIRLNEQNMVEHRNLDSSTSPLVLLVKVG
jgi:hypothetical protein